MEKMTVIGRKKLDFTPKGQQEPVTGVHLFCTHPATNSDGLVGEKIFINTRSEMYPQAEALTFPCEINVNFNRYGKPESFEVIPGENVSEKNPPDKK